MAGHITKRVVDSLGYGKNGSHARSQHILWDNEVRGFGIRVHPSGRKNFVLFYRFAGRKRLVSLGGYPEITVEQARGNARATLYTVSKGVDPVEEERHERQQTIDFGELADRFLEDHSKVHKKSARDDLQRIRDFLKPAWGSKPATSIRRPEVAELHLKIGKRATYAANRTLSLVSKIFNWGTTVGLLPTEYPNPTRGIVRYREQSRDRFLSQEEVGRLLKAIDSEPSVHIRAFFWLSLLLGTRKSELLRAKWDDVDLKSAVLTIPETKALRAGRRSAPHHIPLARPARRILRELPHEAKNPFVFPGARDGAALVNVEDAWRRARAAANVGDVRFHDLRRTLASWLAQGNVALGLIGAVLNHSQPQTTAIYARFGERDTRNALEAHASAVLKAARRIKAAS
jgi:integrase